MYVWKKHKGGGTMQEPRKSTLLFVQDAAAEPAALGAFAAGLSGHSIPAGVLALCAGTLGYLAGRRNG